jgi:protein-tyrosine phosphatase
LIDLHSHVLPGLDDGATDVEEAVEMCRAAAADGIEMLAATPHVRDDYPTTPERMESALAELKAAARGSLRLLPGGELALEELRRPVEELRRFGLGGNPSYLLVETPYRGWPLGIGHQLAELQASGIVTVLAHPERNPEVQLRPTLLEPLVAAGSLVQLTAAALDGRLGQRTRDCARHLLDLRLAHLIASDAHAPSVRAIGMRSAAEAVRNRALAHWLTVDVPRAIVYRLPIPARPIDGGLRFSLRG